MELCTAHNTKAHVRTLPDAYVQQLPVSKPSRDLVMAALREILVSGFSPFTSRIGRKQQYPALADWIAGDACGNPALVVLLLFPSQAVLAGPFFPPACSPRTVLVRECQSKLRTFGCNPKLALEAFFFIQQNKKNRAAQ